MWTRRKEPMSTRANKSMVKWGMVILVLVLLSCRSQPTSDLMEKMTMVKNCMTNWEYESLPDTQEVKVLFAFERYRETLVSSPNFIIGVNQFNDTIAIVDSGFIRNLRRRPTIRFGPVQFQDDKGTIPKAPVLFSKKDKFNEMLCSIDTVFFGKALELQKIRR